MVASQMETGDTEKKKQGNWMFDGEKEQSVNSK
jgi:hypothetical protein